MNRTIWSVVLAMLVAGAVAIPVIAQPPQGGRGPGRGPHLTVLFPFSVGSI